MDTASRPVPAARSPTSASVRPVLPSELWLGARLRPFLRPQVGAARQTLVASTYVVGLAVGLPRLRKPNTAMSSAEATPKPASL